MAQQYSKKITLLVVLISILSTSLLGQDSQGSKKYKREAIYFLKFITQSVLKNEKALVIDDVLSNKGPFTACGYCLNFPNFGDSIFTKKEIAMAYKKMMDTTVKYKLFSAIGKQVHLYNANGIHLESVIQFFCGISNIAFLPIQSLLRQKTQAVALT